MGACGDEQTMSASAFASHLEELVDDIRDKAADKVVEALKEERTRVNTGLMLSSKENPPEPASEWYLWKDHGDSATYAAKWAWDRVQEVREEYGVDLFEVTDGEIEDYRSSIRDEHLTWVGDYFQRGKDLPDFDLSIDAADEYAVVGGQADLSKDAEAAEPGDVISDEMADAVAGLDGALGDDAVKAVPGIVTKVADWDSAAADMFKEHFLPNIPVAMQNQIVVAQTLRNSLAANVGLVKWARHDVDAIAHDMIAALDFEASMSECDNDVKAMLGIAAGVATIAAGVATIWAGGGGAAVAAGGFTILAGSLSTLQNINVEEADVPKELGAETVEEMFDNLREALDYTYGQLDDGDSKFAEFLGGLADFMESGENKKAFVAPRPNSIADADQGNIVDVVD